MVYRPDRPGLVAIISRTAAKETSRMTNTPKSAIELVMERLAKQDAEAGAESRSLTEAQKLAITAARRDYEAGTAECRILHDSTAATIMDPEARAQFEANYRRDLARLVSERDRKIEKVLEESA